jgi:hypothetical protein
MKFVRIVQVEYSQPIVDPQPRSFDVDGVALTVRPRDPSETEIRRLVLAAEVPLDGRPDVDRDGKIVITEDVARQAEKAIELIADLLAVTTFSARKIFSAVPTAGFSGLTVKDREWLAGSSGLLQTPSRLGLSPAPVGITQDMLSDLDDRRDGVSLLAEALANNHETGRFRELARFFELAFRAEPKRIVGPLSDFLSHYDKLQYTHSEVEEWHDLRHRATHADRPGRRYVLCRDVRPVLQRVQFAAYDVLFNKLNWNAEDPARRDVWYPPGGILRDGQHAVLRLHSSANLQAGPLFDGFGAYPYDSRCKVRDHPADWWLDTSFPIKGESTFETMASLRS